MERSGQHFLLSPKVRDLTITELSRIQERTAYKWFRQARWPETDGESEAMPLLLRGCLEKGGTLLHNSR